MPIKPIVTVPNEILLAKTQKVGAVDDEIKSLIKDLIDTLSSATNPEGAGLAAPQIGSNKRVCIVRKFYKDPNDEEKIIHKDYALVNPKIISNSDETDIRYEGCLSIPNQYGKVQRYKKVKVKALDEKGEPVRITATGFFGRVMQHEIDHLDGVLFTSKVIGETLTEEELDNLYEEKE